MFLGQSHRQSSENPISYRVFREFVNGPTRNAGLDIYGQYYGQLIPFAAALPI